MIAPVSVSRCDSYDDEEVANSLAECLGRIGGIERFVKPGYNVALKANLVSPTGPSRGRQHILP